MPALKNCGQAMSPHKVVDSVKSRKTHIDTTSQNVYSLRNFFGENENENEKYFFGYHLSSCFGRLFCS